MRNRTRLSIVGSLVAIFMLIATAAYGWKTDESADAFCGEDGLAYINVWFFNDEPEHRDDLAMDVVAVDMQSGESVDMGTIEPQASGSAVIATGLSELNDGTVRFDLTWSDGHGGTDTRYAKYKATGDCTPEEPGEFHIGGEAMCNEESWMLEGTIWYTASNLSEHFVAIQGPGLLVEEPVVSPGKEYQLDDPVVGSYDWWLIDASGDGLVVDQGTVHVIFEGDCTPPTTTTMPPETTTTMPPETTTTAPPSTTTTMPESSGDGPFGLSSDEIGAGVLIVGAIALVIALGVRGRKEDKVTL